MVILNISNFYSDMNFGINDIYKIKFFLIFLRLKFLLTFLKYIANNKWKRDNSTRENKLRIIIE